MKQLLFFLLVSASLFAEVSLDTMMSYREMQKTGVDNLSYSQKKALEEWIDQNFEERESRPERKEEQLFLSLNIDNGEKLQLSDGSTYLIDPEDHIYTAYWITPFPVMLGRSDSSEFPVKITNMNTKTSVKGKKIPAKEVLEEKQPSPPPPRPTPPEQKKSS